MAEIDSRVLGPESKDSYAQGQGERFRSKDGPAQTSGGGDAPLPSSGGGGGGGDAPLMGVTSGARDRERSQSEQSGKSKQHEASAVWQRRTGWENAAQPDKETIDEREDKRSPAMRSMARDQFKKMPSDGRGSIDNKAERILRDKRSGDAVDSPVTSVPKQHGRSPNKFMGMPDGSKSTGIGDKKAAAQSAEGYIDVNPYVPSHVVDDALKRMEHMEKMRRRAPPPNPDPTGTQHEHHFPVKGGSGYNFRRFADDTGAEAVSTTGERTRALDFEDEVLNEDPRDFIFMKTPEWAKRKKSAPKQSSRHRSSVERTQVDGPEASLSSTRRDKLEKGGAIPERPTQQMEKFRERPETNQTESHEMTVVNFGQLQTENWVRNISQAMTGLIDSQPYLHRDDMAECVARGFDDTQLRKLASTTKGREFLARVYDHLVTGIAGREQQRQSMRILKEFARLDTPLPEDSEWQSPTIPVKFKAILGARANLSATLTEDAQIRLKVPNDVKYNETFRAETRTLPARAFTKEGLILNPTQWISIKDYDNGEITIKRPALYLLQLANQSSTENATNIVTVASTAALALQGGLAAAAARQWTPGQLAALAARESVREGWSGAAVGVGIKIGALHALSKAAAVGDKAALWADVLCITVRESSAWIIKRFGDEGRRFVEAIDYLGILAGAYGIGRLGLAGAEAVAAWRAVKVHAAKLKGTDLEEFRKLEGAIDTSLSRIDDATNQLQTARRADIHVETPSQRSTFEYQRPANKGLPYADTQPGGPQPPARRADTLVETPSQRGTFEYQRPPDQGLPHGDSQLAGGTTQPPAPAQQRGAVSADRELAFADTGLASRTEPPQPGVRLGRQPTDFSEASTGMSRQQDVETAYTIPIHDRLRPGDARRVNPHFFEADNRKVSEFRGLNAHRDQWLRHAGDEMDRLGPLINQEAGGAAGRHFLRGDQIADISELSGGVNEAKRVRYFGESDGVMKTWGETTLAHGDESVFAPANEALSALVSKWFGQLPSSKGGAVNGSVPETVVGILKYGNQYDDLVSVQRLIEPGVTFQGKRVEKVFFGDDAGARLKKVDLGEINTAAVVDVIIGARDRHLKNIGVVKTTDKNYHVVAIDNGYSFHADPRPSGLIRGWNKSEFVLYSHGKISNADKTHISRMLSDTEIDKLPLPAHFSGPVAERIKNQMRARRDAILKMEDYAELESLYDNF